MGLATTDWNIITALAAAATALATVVIATTGVAAVIYAKRQLIDFRKEARIQHLIDASRDFERPPLTKLRENLAKQRVPNDELIPITQDDPPSSFYDVLNFLEHLAMLTNGGYLSLEDVWDEFSYWIFNIYVDARSVIESERKEDPTFYRHLVELVPKLERLQAEKAGRYAPPTQDDIRYFYLEEKRASTGGHFPQGGPHGRRAVRSRRTR